MAQNYCPKRGDLLRLGPGEDGSETAAVLSPKPYNKKTGRALICAVTAEKKDYPFEVDLPEEMTVEGVVLADRVRSLDWRATETRPLGKLPGHTLDEILGKLGAILGT